MKTKFLLTPALSLREREEHSAAPERSGISPFTIELETILPLPRKRSWVKGNGLCFASA